jgi:AcrR family transcriptional regulator
VTETRERFIAAATKAFAESGFDGTSIAAIAAALPFTKQALLHHFGSKEKLYGEVLKRISDRLMRELDDAPEQSSDPLLGIEETFIEFYRSAIQHGDETQLLMRELLDNRRRADTARTWYLKPFLDTLTDRAMDIPQSGMVSRHEALAFVYQILGAITYFVVSEPTLRKMYGNADFLALRDRFEDELRELVSARLKSRSQAIT